MELSNLKWVNFSDLHISKAEFSGDDWEKRPESSLENGTYIVEEIFFHNNISYGFFEVMFNKVFNTYNFGYSNILRIARIK